jgi:hypothetical protein
VEPLPEQVLADCRRILDEVIAPATADGFAREQAGLLSSLLEHVRLRIVLEHDQLVEDTADMRETLGGLDGSAGAAAEVPGRSAGVPSIADLRAENTALRQVLADAVDTLEGPGGDPPAELKEVRALLRRQLDRDRRMIGPGYAKGT